MNLLLQVSALVALIAFVALAITAVITLVRISKTARIFGENFTVLKKDIHELKEKSLQSLEQVDKMKTTLDVALNEISQFRQRTEKSLDVADDTMLKIGTATEDIKNRSNEFFGMLEPFEKLFANVYKKISTPVWTAATAVSAAGKAIDVFSGFLKKKKD